MIEDVANDSNVMLQLVLKVRLLASRDTFDDVDPAWPYTPEGPIRVLLWN